jgi:hypothetical protein
MSDPTAPDDLGPLDRWAVPLDEPTPAAPPPAAAPPADEPPPELLRFPLDADVPTDEFQPRLLRFGKAG